jgi:hypothetical protein
MMRPLLAALLAAVAPAGVFGQKSVERWILMPELRVGSLDGPIAFANITQVVASADERRLYVRDGREASIRILDAATGAQMGRVGRGGQGPGEFEVLGRIGLKQDTLCAVDPRQARIVFFSSDGDHIRTVGPLLVKHPAGRFHVVPFAVSVSGDVWSERLGSDGILNGSVTSFAIALVSRNGEFRRHVADRDVAGIVAKAAVGNSFLIFEPPLAKRSVRNYAPDGSSLVTVEAAANAQFVVTRFGPNGDTLYRRSFGYTPQRVPALVRDTILRQYARGFSRSLSPGQAMAAARNIVPFPDVQPPVSAITVSTSGAVWLRREESGTPDVEWLVLTPSGSVQAAVRVPSDVAIMTVTTAAVWGSRNDRDGVPYLVRYRIAPDVRTQRSQHRNGS